MVRRLLQERNNMLRMYDPTAGHPDKSNDSRKSYYRWEDTYRYLDPVVYSLQYVMASTGEKPVMYRCTI